MEGKMINDASKIVCLTQSAKKYIIYKYKKNMKLYLMKRYLLYCGTDFDFNLIHLILKRIKFVF